MSQDFRGLVLYGLLSDRGLVARDKLELLPGSGVDLQRFGGDFRGDFSGFLL